jgi:Na+-driven multidrug efflux pump
MYTATTNLVASAFESDRNNEDKSQTISTVITSLQLGLIVGLIFGVSLGTSATYLIRSLIGKGQEIDVEVLSAAEKYVRIRALGMPAAVIIGAAQSACLGMKDTRSPLIVMVAAALINFLGDIVFVGSKSPWLGGAAGAAWATTISQYAALIMFLRWLKMKKAPEGVNTDATLSSGDHQSASIKDLSSTRGVLHGHFRYKDFLKAPSSYKTVKKFLQYIIPVTTTAIGRVSGYVAMSHVVSSALGTVDLAAQQIVLAFFLCFIPMCDSLNLTAQSFVPGIFEYKDDARLRSTVMKQTVKNFLKAGSIFGLALMGVVSCIPLVSKFFSHDPNVILSVNSTTLYISLYALLSGIVCSGEGL